MILPFPKFLQVRFDFPLEKNFPSKAKVALKKFLNIENNFWSIVRNEILTIVAFKRLFWINKKNILINSAY